MSAAEVDVWCGPDGTVACALATGAASRPVLRAVAPSATEPSRPRARGRARAARRRRRVAASVAVGGLLVALSLPLRSLGAAPAAHEGAGTGGAVPVGATVYVAEQGDTVWSIAARFDQGGDPRPLAEAIAAETGSGMVVPGERIAIP